MTLNVALATFIGDVFDRAVAMAQVCVPDAIAAPYASFDYPPGVRLFWTMRLDPVAAPITVSHGANEYLFTISIVARLHSGWLTQGLPGDLETDIQETHIPTVLVYFWERPDLVYTAGQSPPLFYVADGFGMSCPSGLTLFEDERDSNRRMLGAEFRLQTQAQIPIKRAI